MGISGRLCESDSSWRSSNTHNALLCGQKLQIIFFTIVFGIVMYIISRHGTHSFNWVASNRFVIFFFFALRYTGWHGGLQLNQEVLWDKVLLVNWLSEVQYVMCNSGLSGYWLLQLFQVFRHTTPTSPWACQSLISYTILFINIKVLKWKAFKKTKNFWLCNLQGKDGLQLYRLTYFWDSERNPSPRQEQTQQAMFSSLRRAETSKQWCFEPSK